MRKRILIILLLVFLTITLPVPAQNEEMMMLMGGGDDVIDVSLDVFDYPLIEFYSACMEPWQTVTLTAVLEDGYQYPILDSAPCDRGGVFFIGHLAPAILELIQIETEGEWQLIFLRSENIPWYEAPVTVSGNGSAVFAVNNHGKAASFWTDDKNNYEVVQYGAQDQSVSNTVFAGFGPYSGKKIISNGSPLFAINAGGDWELSLDDGAVVNYVTPAQTLFANGQFENLLSGFVLPDFLDFQSGIDAENGVYEYYFLHYLLSQFEGITGNYHIDSYAKLSDPAGRIPEMLNEVLVDFYQDAYPEEYFLTGYPLYGMPVLVDEDDYRMVWRTALTGRDLEVTFFIVASDVSGNVGPFDIYLLFSSDIYPKG